MSESVRCSKRVYDGSWPVVQCSRRMVIERQGKPYCTQHDPERVAARRVKAEEQAQAKRDASDQRFQSAMRLAEQLGVGQPHYDAMRTHDYTGGIMLTAEEAQRLIERRKDGEP